MLIFSFFFYLYFHTHQVVTATIKMTKLYMFLLGFRFNEKLRAFNNIYFFS
uniref:Uncharacterized protein n=1 Tax=Rhizophora mucronata TaxID=61149 RepID=A0A2P2IUW3_RHIMU